MSTQPDEENQSNESPDLIVNKSDWEDFTEHLKAARDDFRAAIEDLRAARKALGRLAVQIRGLPETVKGKFQTRVQSVINQISIPFFNPKTPV
ncbi:MAG: hypothetical protein ABEK50_02040 [bacterium]